MCINFVAIVLSVLGVLTPTTGALVHNAGSCFVVLIAALLYDRKFDKKNFLHCRKTTKILVDMNKKMKKNQKFCSLFIRLVL